MKHSTSLLIAFCSGLLLMLAGCGPATQQMGLCSYLGACPEAEGCKDGVREDGSSCDEEEKKPTPAHSVGTLGGDDAD